MSLYLILAILGTVLGIGLALVVVWREQGSVARFSFCCGILLLSVEALLGGISFQMETSVGFMEWQWWKFFTLAFLPFVWLLFSISYARGNSKAFLKRWGGVVAVGLVINVVACTLLGENLFAVAKEKDGSGNLVLELGFSGLLVHFLHLLALVAILVNLERTLRASVGVMRWQIKYMMMGLATLFVARLYTCSQILLFRATTYPLQSINAAAFLISCLIMAFAFSRSKLFKVDVYPSQTVISGSITGLLAGIYLLVIGAFAKVVTLLGGDDSFPIKAFVVLISLVLLTSLLLSERYREKVRRWVSRNFRRPYYDYRALWTTFTARTSSTVSEPELCRAVVTWISETFHILSVNIWLADDNRKQLGLAASTSVTGLDTNGNQKLPLNAPEILQAMNEKEGFIDLDKSGAAWAESLKEVNPDNFRSGGNRICVPLVQGEDFLGLVVMGDRVNGVPFSIEDVDFLKCIRDQVAASLHHIQLSQRLLRAKEMEAFQTMSTFFVHDLKNTASTLSLMVQNLPLHFEDPDFRKDALRAISKSADRINDLIQRLSMLRQKLEIRLAESNLGDVVEASLQPIRGALRARLEEDYAAVPNTLLDSEQLQKVIVNLVLNANDASGPDGVIRVRTRAENGFVCLSVEDNGCGMSPEFINRSLFRPFQTTKKKGIGIGLFQSKMIVEAQSGKIEVESEVNKGSTFRVLLPIKSVSR